MNIIPKKNKNKKVLQSKKKEYNKKKGIPLIKKEPLFINK